MKKISLKQYLTIYWHMWSFMIMLASTQPIFRWEEQVTIANVIIMAMWVWMFIVCGNQMRKRF